MGMSLDQISSDTQGELRNHILKFHKMTDAKEMWDAIKSRFGGNDESKKMQKYILKQQFEGFSSGGMHAVPPPMTGNYMPSGPDIEVDYSQFTYGPKQTQPSESESQSKCQPKSGLMLLSLRDESDSEDRGSKKEDESAQDCLVLPIWSSYSSTITPELKTDAKREGPREVERVFLDELKRLKRQEKDANKAAEALRKDTPAKASSTNLVNTIITPVSTASPHDGLSFSDLINPEQDDSEIPPLEDIYQNSTYGIFTHSPYDDEGSVADFTNLETVVMLYPNHIKDYLFSSFSSYSRRSNLSSSNKKQTIFYLLVPAKMKPKRFQSSEDESETDPSPRPSPSTTIHDSIPESSGGNLGGHSSNDKSLSGNEGEMTLQSG
ncbi:hypothetical protein Tco_1181987 [Tanacetum coccineum]